MHHFIPIMTNIIYNKYYNIIYSIIIFIIYSIIIFIIYSIIIFIIYSIIIILYIIMYKLSSKSIPSFKFLFLILIIILIIYGAFIKPFSSSESDLEGYRRLGINNNILRRDRRNQ